MLAFEGREGTTMLVSMTTEQPTRRIVRPKSPGTAIAARRKYLGLTQADVAELSHGVLNERLQTRIENDEKSVASLALTKYHSYLDVLQWTFREFKDATGYAPAVEEMPHARPYNPSFWVPIAGTVSAGLTSIGGEMDDVDTMPVDLEAQGLQGVNRNSLVWLIVNGDSMVSDTVARNIPRGSMVLVEVGGLPSDGDLVVAYLPKRDAMVVKQYRESADAVLRSYNPTGPAFRAADEPIEVRGVVKLVQFKPGG